MSMVRPSTNTIATEATEAGEQHLVPGIAPVTLSERLAMLAAQPMAPRRNPTAPQKPCDVGLAACPRAGQRPDPGERGHA